jgi:signal transduction histidine kinase
MPSVASILPNHKQSAAPRPIARENIRRYGLGLVSVTVALGIALLESRSGLRHQMSTVLFGIAFAAWYGGLGPAILAVVYASVAYDYFFTEPIHSLAASPDDLPDYALFVLFSLLVGWFGVIRQRTEAELRQSRDVLNLEVEQRRALNRELEKRSDELQSTNKELEAFAYSVSHDLRAPIRHITGFSELLQKHAGLALDDKSRHHLSMVLDSAKRMGILVDDLLAFSRIGRAETQRTTVNLDQLIKTVVGDIAPDTQDRRIAWKIGSLPICQGDATMFRLVFANLIANAVKFTRTREQAEIEIGSLNHSPGEIVVFVKDNGVGFNMKYQDKLFGVFQRLHPQEAFEGTGIGLATVQRIVQRHSGRVWGEGQVDNGATFYVALPKQ